MENVRNPTYRPHMAAILCIFVHVFHHKIQILSETCCGHFLFNWKFFNQLVVDIFGIF